MTCRSSGKLSDYKGKFVVLEWVIWLPVRAETLQQRQHAPAAERCRDDVVWLTIDSTQPSHEDFNTSQQLSAWLADKGAAPRAAMLDSDGKVGKLYEAKATPNTYGDRPAGKLDPTRCDRR